MRRTHIFWGLALILLGVLFFLQASGFLRVENVFSLFWPIVLILLGGWILFGVFFPGKTPAGVPSSEAFAIQLDGARSLHVEINHGAGKIELRGGAEAGVAVSGLRAPACNISSDRDGDALDVDIDAGPTFMPFLSPEGGAWQFQVSNEVPLNLELHAGATSLLLDLHDVKLEKLDLNMGASNVQLLMPALGNPVVDIDMGAASLDMSIPEGVAARIRLEEAVSSIDIDPARFPRLGHGHYESPDFASALNRVDISLDGGANTVVIHS